MSDRTLEMHTADVERVHDVVSGLFCPFRLTTRPVRYDAHLRHDTLGALAFTTIAYGERVEVDVAEGQPRFLLQLPLHGAFDTRTTGPEYRATPATVQVVRPGTPLHMSWTGDCRILVVSGDVADLEPQARALAGDDIAFPSALPEELRLAGAGESLGRCIQLLHAEAQRPDSLLRSGDAARPAVQMLMALLLQTAGVRGRAPKPAAASGRARAWYVKRAEAFMDANLASPIGIADVAASAGVSLRTLNYGFHSHHGVAPMTWLKNRRLDRVREALRAADPAETNVTEVALGWGFAHLGRFAADYRARFGESPSQTLRRG